MREATMSEWERVVLCHEMALCVDLHVEESRLEGFFDSGIEKGGLRLADPELHRCPEYEGRVHRSCVRSQCQLCPNRPRRSNLKHADRL